jgi:hypothetical protein
VHLFMRLTRKKKVETRRVVFWEAKIREEIFYGRKLGGVFEDSTYYASL